VNVSGDWVSGEAAGASGWTDWCSGKDICTGYSVRSTEYNVRNIQRARTSLVVMPRTLKRPTQVPACLCEQFTRGFCWHSMPLSHDGCL
jgi:hypothetical protein